MPGIAIKPNVQAELQRQFNQELGAAQSYTALALWCEHQNFKGFAAYLFKQANEERDHARKFMDHLLDRGVLPELTALPAPKARFDSLLAIAQEAQSMERINTQGINRAFEAALEARDYPAQVFLQGFIKEQVEEEKWTDEMVNRVEGATCAGGLSDLDRHIERYLEGDTKG